MSLAIAIRFAGLPGTAGSRPARTGGLSGGRIVRRNLAAPGSGAARIGVLAAPGSGSARPVAVLVVNAVAGKPRHAGAAFLLGGGLAPTALRSTARLGSPVHLGSIARQRTGARLRTAAGSRATAGLVFTVSGGASTSFRVICHRIAPEMPPLHFVRRRSGGSAWDALTRTARCLVFN